jgi:hypothetical protein
MSSAYGVPTGARLGSLSHAESHESGAVNSESESSCGWIAFVVGLPKDSSTAI